LGTAGHVKCEWERGRRGGEEGVVEERVLQAWWRVGGGMRNRKLERWGERGGRAVKGIGEGRGVWYGEKTWGGEAIGNVRNGWGS